MRTLLRFRLRHCEKARSADEAIHHQNWPEVPLAESMGDGLPRRCGLTAFAPRNDGVFFAGFVVFLSLFFFTPAQAKDTWLGPVMGQGYGVQVKEGRTSDKELAMIKAAGLDTVRFVIPWYEVEKGRGAFVWGYFDTFVQRLREHKLKAVIVLGGGHPDYTGVIKAQAGNLDQADTTLRAPASPQEIAAFANYAAKTASHFGGDDIIWELWNEPDQNRFWAPSANVKDYIATAQSACQAIRKAQPKAKIIGPGMAEMAGRWGTLRTGFLGAVLRSPLPSCLDALSMHPYRDGETPPETVLPAYKKLRAFIKAYTPENQKPLPVVASEWGFSLTDVSEDEQAAFLLRSFLLNTYAGVPLSIWYEWRDARPGDDDPEAHFGLLTLREKEKPSYRALRDFLPPLKGARIEGRVETGRAEEFILKLKKTDGRLALVVWTSGAPEEAALLISGCAAQPQAIRLTAMPTAVDCQGNAGAVSAVREKKARVSNSDE